MRNLAHEAGFRALDELKEGRTDIVVLMPRGWGAIAFDMGVWPEGVFPRFSDQVNDSLPTTVQTLIVVGHDHVRDVFLWWRSKLTCHSDPRIVLINNEPHMVFEGNEVLSNDVMDYIDFCEEES